MNPPAPRLFFALWPDTDLAHTLDAGWIAPAHAHCGGRRMRPDTLHLTLAFLGAVDPAHLEPLAALTRGLRVQPGEIRLSQYGRFDRAAVVWAGPESADTGLSALHDGLWHALAPWGWSAPAQPFRPHVTLLRDTRETPPPPPAPLVWRYDRCVLVRSEPGGGARYHVVAQSAAPDAAA